MTITRRLPALALALAALAAGSCLDDLAPDVGAPLQERCTNEDTDPTTSVSFERDLLQGIFLREAGGCVSCHSPSADNPIGLQVGGLDLTSYLGLRKGGASSGAGVVVPGQPCGSVLVQKVGPGPPFGSRMPMNGPPFLTPDELRLIHDWIAEGALDN